MGDHGEPGNPTNALMRLAHGAEPVRLRERCPECGSVQWYEDGDWDEETSATVKGETMTAILSAESFEPTELTAIPDGDYPGVWGGYEAKAVINGRKCRFRTKDGIRTPKAPCVIHIRDGVGTVEAPDNMRIPEEWR